MTGIEQRLEKLERQARWYRMGFFGLLLMMAALVTVAAAPQMDDAEFDTVTANRVVIKNHNGENAIGLESNIGGYMTIFNNDGKQAIGLAAGDNGGYIVVYNGAEKQVAWLHNSDNGGRVLLKDKSGNETVESYTDEAGRGYVNIKSTNGTERTITP